ncbi:ABC transporter substrate-binding protein [Halorussus halobius]|uniref:ABC transporter substrate-binding protein n=1 Tax=Halorussus halobius TaxID=1710537 RepID=UPI001FCED0D0|nr:ABC transporter substrate-binding protein [Halorussus halobius]
MATSGLLGGTLLAGCSGSNTDEQATTTTAGDTDDTGGSTTGDQSDGGTTDQSEAPLGGTFIDSTAEDAPTLDPRMNELAWVNSFLPYVFDTLYVMSPDGSEFVPHLAADQPQQEDETTFVIPIRDDVTFHDGEDLTAEDVAYTINWILEPDNASPNRANLDFIDEVEATGDYEVTFNLSYPFALFQLNLTDMNAPVVPKHIAEEQGPEAFGENPIGSGPFQFESQESSSHVELTRYDDYFLQQPNLDAVRMRIIPEAQVQFVELASGGVHEANVPKDLLGRARSEDGIEMSRVPEFDYNGLLFNTMREPFDDVQVREAMQYLVDYDEILNATAGDLGERNYGFMPQEVNESWDFPWEEWRDEFYPEQDYEQAQSLLDDAGYGDGYGETITISSLASSKFKNMAIVLQDELSEIGWDAEVREVTTGQWLDQLDTGDFDVNIYGWSGGQDPDGFFYYLFRDLRNDEGGLDDGVAGNASASFLYQSEDSEELQRIDEQIREARQVIDQDERREIYIDIAESLQGMYPHIPAFSEAGAVAWSTSVQDYEPSAFEAQPLCNQWSNSYIEE